MKYILIAMLLVSVFFIGTAPSQAICNITLTNCLTDDFEWCSYGGDSYWDTLIAADREGTSSGSTVEYGACNSDSSCYFIGVSSDTSWFCLSPDVNGFVDCDEYACVDDSDGLLWYSGSDEYCCSDNTCTTDCD